MARNVQPRRQQFWYQIREKKHARNLLTLLEYSYEVTTDWNEKNMRH